jgi:hypothetical protein
MWINIEPNERQIIEEYPELKYLALRMNTQGEHREHFATQIDQARDKYTMSSDEDVEIDDEPALSVADDGVWVAAWVWISLDRSNEPTK